MNSYWCRCMYVKWVLQSRWRTKTETHTVCLVQKCSTRPSLSCGIFNISCFRGGFISIPSKLNGAEAQIYNCSMTVRVFQVVVREMASSDDPLQNLAPKSKVPPLAEGILCLLNRPSILPCAVWPLLGPFIGRKTALYLQRHRCPNKWYINTQ